MKKTMLIYLLMVVSSMYSSEQDIRTIAENAYRRSSTCCARREQDQRRQRNIEKNHREKQIENELIIAIIAAAAHGSRVGQDEGGIVQRIYDDWARRHGRKDDILYQVLTRVGNVFLHEEV